jgi:hypothetical protein
LIRIGGKRHVPMAKTVLVVDDEPLLLETTAAMLEELVRS